MAILAILVILAILAESMVNPPGNVAVLPKSGENHQKVVKITTFW